MLSNDQKNSSMLNDELFAKQTFFAEVDLFEEADLYDKLQNATNAKDFSQIQAAEEEFIERERLYLLGKATSSARRFEGEQWNIEFDHIENEYVPLFLEKEEEDVMDVEANEPPSELSYFLTASNIGRYNSIGISIKPENKRILCELWEEVNRQSAHINFQLENSSPGITIDWIKMANGCEKECREECQKAYQFYFQERIRLHGGSHDTYSARLNQINTLIKALDEALGEDHEVISHLIVTNSSLINPKLPD